MGRSAVSRQLGYLQEARLVHARRDGRHVFYRLDDDHVRGLFAQGLEHVITADGSQLAMAVLLRSTLYIHKLITDRRKQGFDLLRADKAEIR